MLAEKTPITQGSGMQTGVSPLGGETFLWTAAAVAREVVLVCPAGLEMDELQSYFDALIEYIVSRQSPSSTSLYS